MATKRKKKASPNSIAVNRKARFDYFIEETIEAGIALEGWEVKSLRAGKGQLAESYVVLRNGEAWLLGSHIAPLPTASTHITPDAKRTRKLLLHRKEIDRLTGLVERRGYTLIALEMYWKEGRAKVAIGVAKGKRKHDKRAVEKQRDWEREKARLRKIR